MNEVLIEKPGTNLPGFFINFTRHLLNIHSRKQLLMYILKIKGSSRIPDYIQIRDSEFTLVAYFKANLSKAGLIQCGLGDREKEIAKIIGEIPYGKIFKLPF